MRRTATSHQKRFGGQRSGAVPVVAALVLLANSGVLAGTSPQVEVAVAPLETADRGEMSRVPVRLTVSGNGVGLLRLGQPANEVTAFFGDLLGPPSDVVTVQHPILRGCFGGAVLTTYTWPGVVLSFSGEPGTDRTADRWVNFRFDDRAESDLLLGVQSTHAATFADSLDTWLALHPDATPFEGEPDLIGPTLGFVDGLVAEVGQDETGRFVRTLNALSPIFCE